MTEKKLIAKALRAQKKACAKHTGFAVGAALLGASGKVYAGANVESDIPSQSLCADRAALIAGLNAGERKFKAIAIVTETARALPCGACRQMLYEFCGPGLKVLSRNSRGKTEVFLLGRLLPHPYKMVSAS